MKKSDLLELLEPYENDTEIMVDIPECSSYKDITEVRPGGICAHLVTENIEANFKVTID